MNITIADQYYFKALDLYPWKLGEAVEQLNYALSYDAQHAQSLCLMGQVNMFYMKDYETAEHCFVHALQSNLDYPDTYKYYIILKIWKGDINGAFKLLDYALKKKCADRSLLISLKAVAMESRGQYKSAASLMDEAFIYSLDSDRLKWIELQKSRINKKYRKQKRVKKKMRIAQKKKIDKI